MDDKADLITATEKDMSPGCDLNAPGGSSNAPGGSSNALGGSSNALGGSLNALGGSSNAPGGSSNAPGGSSNAPGGSSNALGGSLNAPGGSLNAPIVNSYSLARDVTIMALVVSCNVALELSLGTALHALNLDLTGSIMVVLNAFAYALGFDYRPRFGRVTVMGIATALVTLVIGGGFKFTALPSIAGEAVIIDLLMSWSGLTKRGFLLCGACASLSAFGFKLVNMQIFWGLPLDVALTKVTDSISSEGGIVAIVSVVILSRLAIGALLAWMLWGALQRLRRMLHPQ